MNNDNNFELIGKFLAGEASPEEAIQLDDWINQSDENRLFFNELSLTWAKTNPDLKHVLPDKSKFWAVIPFSEERRTSKNIYLTRVRVAAVFILLIGAATIWLFIKNADRAALLPGAAIRSSEKVLSAKLPDSSSFVLTPGSELNYPGTFNQQNREISIKGECWFNVMHDSSKPFSIHAGDIIIKVTGTSFNVKETLATIEVSVNTGTVEVRSKNANVVLKGDEKATYSKKDDKFEVQKWNEKNSVAYATKIFNFQNLSFEEIVKFLEKAYGVQIQFSTPSLANCRFTTSFDNKSLDYILDVIAATLNVSYRKEHKIIYIDGQGCK